MQERDEPHPRGVMVMKKRKGLFDDVDGRHVGEREATAVDDEGIGLHAVLAGQIQRPLQGIHQVLDGLLGTPVGLRNRGKKGTRKRWAKHGRRGGGSLRGNQCRRDGLIRGGRSSLKSNE